MNLARVACSGFMRHDDTDVVLPRCGVVLVTGRNAQGKSGVLEAVSVALFNKTLRGTDPWRVDGAKGRVCVETFEGLCVVRTRTKSSKRLQWGVGDVEPVTYETPTKGQDALERYLETDFDVWRRAHVFSSHDAAHFTLATDAERKRLLESVLGLDRFDPAAEACAQDVRRARDALLDAEARLRLSKQQEMMEQRRLDEADAMLAAVGVAGDAATARAEERRLRALLTRADEEVTQARAVLRKADTAGAEHAGHARRLRAVLAQLRADTCPTCTQPIPDTLRDRVAQEQAAEEQCVHDAHAHALSAVRDVEAGLGELAAERDVLAQRVTAASKVTVALESGATARVRATQQREGALVALQRALSGAEGAGAALGHAGAQARLSAACAQALGMRGVRACVLSETLGGLESLANGWLGRLGGAVRVQLRAYTERRTGGVSEALGLQVQIGTAPPQPYAASSGGERRRVDVALMLALAQVSAAAHGQHVGSVFFDEALDALDSDGVTAMGTVLEEMARERCVILVTHNPLLAKSVRATVRLEVEAGVVRVR